MILTNLFYWDYFIHHYCLYHIASLPLLSTVHQMFGECRSLLASEMVNTWAVPHSSEHSVGTPWCNTCG